MTDFKTQVNPCILDNLLQRNVNKNLVKEGLKYTDDFPPEIMEIYNSIIDYLKINKNFIRPEAEVKSGNRDDMLIFRDTENKSGSLGRILLNVKTIDNIRLDTVEIINKKTNVLNSKTLTLEQGVGIFLRSPDYDNVNIVLPKETKRVLRVVENNKWVSRHSIRLKNYKSVFLVFSLFIQNDISEPTIHAPLEQVERL